MSDDGQWIEDIKVGECGNGHFARIDGSDALRQIPGRISLSVSEGNKTEKQARAAGIRWLKRQLRKLEKERRDA